MNKENDVCIRWGSAADFPAVTAVWKASVLASHAFLRPEHFASLEREMPRIFLPSVGELWLHYSSDSLTAFCGCNGNRVEMLFVHPRHMREGIGSRLLAYARKLHGPLILEVNEANGDALAFYLAQGFSIVGRSELDGQGRPYPLLHLRQ